MIDYDIESVASGDLENGYLDIDTTIRPKLAYWDKAEMRIGDGEWFDITNVSWNRKRDACEDIVGESVRALFDCPNFIGEEHAPDINIEMRVRLTTPLRYLLCEIACLSDPRYRTLLHVRRNCGPGGHKNSKASRRLLRALGA